MSGVLIHSSKTKLLFELITAAQVINTNVTALTINDDEQAQLAVAKGVKVCKVNIAEIHPYDTVAMAAALCQVAEQIEADMIILSSDKRGKELAGRVAQIFNAGCLTEVRDIKVVENKIQCLRNALGGATIATQTISSLNKVIAIAPKSFEAAEDTAPGSFVECQLNVKGSSVKLLESRSKVGDSVDIGAAAVLVAVGKGLENKDEISTVENIAKSIGGVVACSKPVATDKKWFTEDRIVGLSGSICKPDLAILLGISGQVQFFVGIRDAKTIVAINNDENANICTRADYILVADIKEVLPELNQALS